MRKVGFKNLMVLAFVGRTPDSWRAALCDTLVSGVLDGAGPSCNMPSCTAWPDVRTQTTKMDWSLQQRACYTRDART